MLYRQTTTNQKLNEVKTIPCYKYKLMKPKWVSSNLANLKIMFIWLFLKEVEFTANSKNSIQLSP